MTEWTPVPNGSPTWLPCQGCERREAENRRLRAVIEELLGWVESDAPAAQEAVVAARAALEARDGG